MLRRCITRRGNFGDWGPSHKFGQHAKNKATSSSEPLFKLGSNIHMYANKESAWSNYTTDRFHGAKRIKEVVNRMFGDKGVRYFFFASMLIVLIGFAQFTNMYNQTVAEHGLIGPKKKKYKSRLTVVLDVDETLVSYGDKAFRMKAGLVPRPYLAELLDYLAKIDAEVILWSACSERYMKQVLTILDPNGSRVSHYITRSNDWFSSDNFYEKNIAWLKRNFDDTLIIENRPLSVRNCNANALLVDDFIRAEYMETGRDTPVNDKALRTIKEIIAEINESGEPVQEYLQNVEKRNRDIKEIPCHLAFRQLPDELARGIFFFVGDKYKGKVLDETKHTPVKK